MSRMRVSTRLLPGLWLSQRVSCGGCLLLAAVLACPLLCVATWMLAGVVQLSQSFGLAVIQLWGR